MQTRTESPFSVRDFSRVLFRYKFRSAAVSSAVLALVLIGLILAPRKYSSEARMFVKAGRESVTLDPTATTGQTLQLLESRENEISSLLDVLQSRQLLEKVVDQLGPEMILEEGEAEEDRSPNPIATALGRLKPILVRAGISDPVSDREKAVELLRKSIGIESSRKSAVVVLRSKAKSAEAAQQWLQAYVEAYYALHHRVHQTQGSHGFFSAQAELLEGQLAGATVELRDLKNQLGVISVEGQRAILEKQITNLDRERMLAESELHSAEQRIEALRRAHPNLPRWSEEASASSLTSTAIDEMRDRLYSLQIQEREFSSMYRPDHPRLVAIRKQVDASQQLLDEQELKIEYSRAASLRAKLEKLQHKYAEAQESLRNLNHNEVRIRDLERKVDLLKENYETYAKSSELTRIGDSLQEQRISNVNLVQSPTFVEKPVSPKKLPILLLGVIVAALGGVGAALGSEYMDHSLKTPEEVEQWLAVPVLASIPRVRRRPLGANGDSNSGPGRLGT